MSKFTQQEVNTICLFFGVAPSADVFELGEFFVLEDGSINHPIGDKLEIMPNGIKVSFVDDKAPAAQHPWYFSRDFAGLVAALEKLTEEIA